MARPKRRDPLYCEHDRTAATCEDCAHAAALADQTRAAVTRDALHPFTGGPVISSGFLARDEVTGETVISPGFLPESPAPSRKKRSGS